MVVNKTTIFKKGDFCLLDMKKNRLGSTKRYGTRYGASVKEKVGKIEKIQRSLQKCPHCNKVALKRVSRGIFVCKACGVTVAGKAYAIK